MIQWSKTEVLKKQIDSIQTIVSLEQTYIKHRGALMLKNKKRIAIVLAYCILLGAFLVSRYTLGFSKSLANAFPAGVPFASYQKFHVIVHDLDEMEDLRIECKRQLGKGMRLADWNDIVAFYESGGSLDEFISNLEMKLRTPWLVSKNIIGEPSNELDPSQSNDSVTETDPRKFDYRITMDGNLRWQGNRHYFVERHDHVKRPGFLDHDDINNQQLTLGSWHGKGGYALCYGNLISIPQPFSKTLRVITPIVVYLFVGCLLLCSVLGAMHVLSLPGWLIGSNVDAILLTIQKKENEIRKLRKYEEKVGRKIEEEKVELNTDTDDLNGNNVEQ